MRKYPKVSVILPTHNRAKRLTRAVESVLNQNLKNFELIIVNDGSTDGTSKMILKFKDSRIVYLEKPHGGVSAARNFGLAMAKGKYISYLDDDDVYYLNHLELLSGFLDKHPHIGLVYGNVHFKTRKEIFLPYSFDYSKERLEIDNIIPTQALMHKKECLKKAGFFDENLSVGEDWDLWLRISDYYKIYHLNSAVAQVVFHGKNKTHNTMDYSRWYIYAVKKRLSQKGHLAKKSFPFEGYCMALVYRLIYKFKAEKQFCIRFIEELKSMDNTNPETRMALCAAYLSYGEIDKAINTGRRFLKNLSKRVERMSNLEKSCAFNLHRLLAFAFKRKNDSHQMQFELKRATQLIWKGYVQCISFADLTSTTAKFLNQLTG